jgi:hypothetical protein
MPFIDENTLDRIAASARKATGSSKKVMETAVRKTADALEVGGTAGLLAYADARWGTGGTLSLAGLPMDLLVALGGLGTAWFNLAGDYSHDAEMIGSGALAAYLARVGASYGAAAAVPAAAALPAKASGQGGPELVGRYGPGRDYGRHEVSGSGKKYVVTEVAHR